MLPSNFTQLEYIESSGTQYVDTKFIPNQDTRVLMSAQMTSAVAPSFYFGARESSATNASMNFNVLYTASGVRSDYGASKIASDAETVTNQLYIDKNKNVCLVGSTTIINEESTFQSAYSLFLAASNDGGTAKYFGYLDLYSCKIYDNGTLVRDFIPCKNANEEIGLWDDVNSVFYGNEGTGTFEAGPVAPQEMLERSIVKLEYIESTGIQHVDTKFIPNQDTRVTMDIEITSIAQYGSYLFGIRKKMNSLGFSAVFLSNQFWTEYKNEMGGTSTTVSLSRYAVDANKNVFALYENGELLKTVTRTYDDFTCEHSVMLLALISTDKTTEYTIYQGTQTSGKLYSCQIYDNDALVRDFVPCTTSSGEVGLYDRVYGYFYRNAGSGVFTAGPEIPAEPPAVPENFRVISERRTAISLAWDGVENATSYQLRQNGAQILDADVTSYTASGLVQETEYEFSLAAVNRGGSSEAVTLTAKTTAFVLVADRTQADVTARNEKGTYGASDLNRVGDAVSYLKALLEQLGHLVPVDPKLDWTEYDWPTPSNMQRYLQDVETVRSKLTMLSTTPKTPDSMEYLTHTKANDIEQILLDVDAAISALKKTVVPCGAATCGGDYL